MVGSRRAPCLESEAPVHRRPRDLMGREAFPDFEAETEGIYTDRFDPERSASLFSAPSAGAVDDHSGQDEHDEDQGKKKGDPACQNKTFPSEHKSATLNEMIPEPEAVS